MKNPPRFTAVARWVEASMVGRLARVRSDSGPMFLWNVTVGVEGLQLDTRARVDGFIGRVFLHEYAAFFKF